MLEQIAPPFGKATGPPSLCLLSLEKGCTEDPLLA